MIFINARIVVKDEIPKKIMDGTNHLYFQKVEYRYSNGEVEMGYRFIWRREDGSLRAARGQACISTLDVAENLIKQAREQGWE